MGFVNDESRGWFVCEGPIEERMDIVRDGRGRVLIL